MNKLVTLAACLALAACAEAEAPEAEERADTAAMAEPAATGPEPGLYEVTMADGSTVHTRLNADGTFVGMVDGAEVATGTWRFADGQLCSDAEGDELGEECWIDAPPGPDGSWISTRTDGETVTVRKIEVDTGAEMAPSE